MTSFQHVPVCGFFELYNLFDTITFQTACTCRLTDNQICETTDILSFDRNSGILCVSKTCLVTWLAWWTVTQDFWVRILVDPKIFPFGIAIMVSELVMPEVEG